MNILKTFRKPYLSILLSSLILFVSCGQENLQIENILEQQTGSNPNDWPITEIEAKYIWL
jgi:hypothetical protein